MSTEHQFISAFNNGYTLAKFEPQLLDTVTKNLTPSNIYLEGLFEGKEQYALELSNNKQLDELRSIETLRAKSQMMEKER